MKNKTVGFVIAILCYSAAIAGAFYFVGYQTASGRMKATALDAQTFYATISDIRGDTFTVTGMEVNDINFRGEFCFSIEKETKLLWRYTDISADDLEVGDHISITFTGGVLETYPGQLQHVTVIQLLDDEK